MSIQKRNQRNRDNIERRSSLCLTTKAAQRTTLLNQTNLRDADGPSYQSSMSAYNGGQFGIERAVMNQKIPVTQDMQPLGEVEEIPETSISETILWAEFSAGSLTDVTVDVATGFDRTKVLNYYRDQIGSVRMVTKYDETTNSIVTVWSGDYTAYGEILTEDYQMTWLPLKTFALHEYDRETGFYYAQARWYDPETGSFTSEDGAQDGLNWYAYCGESPLGNVDPTGRAGTNNGPLNVTTNNGRARLIIQEKDPLPETYYARLELMENMCDFLEEIVMPNANNIVLNIDYYFFGGKNDYDEASNYYMKQMDEYFQVVYELTKDPESMTKEDMELIINTLNQEFYDRYSNSGQGVKFGNWKVNKSFALDPKDSKYILDSFKKAKAEVEKLVKGTDMKSEKIIKSKKVLEKIDEILNSMEGFKKSPLDKNKEDQKKDLPKIDKEKIQKVLDEILSKSKSEDESNSENNKSGEESGNKIICKELHGQGLMDDVIFQADEKFGYMLAIKYPEIISGYHAWAKPVVELMKKSRTFTIIVNVFAKPWSEEMAYMMKVRDKGNLFGKVLMYTGIPICYIIGNIADNELKPFDIILILIIGYIIILVLKRVSRNRNKMIINKGAYKI